MTKNQNFNIPDDLKIPGHRLIRELGRGGMASVYLAMQESMEREVALKVMLPSLGAADANFSERFVREARIVAKLSHPHIIAVYDVGVAGPYHYFSMEYHTGGDLKARIHDGMMPKMALAITRQIASALAFAHSKGYIHRDVKPENVMFRHDGTALLTDFGIAKADDTASRMTATGAVIGTPHYMSPEQAQGLELDQRADLYSLGIMFFEMLTGVVPFTGNSALSIGLKHLKEPVPPLPANLRVYQPLVEKLLAKSPDDRFQRGEEVIDVIDAMSSGVNHTMTSSPTVITGSNTTGQPTIIAGQTKTQITGTPAVTPSRRGLAIAVAVLVPVIAAGAYLFLRTPSQTTAPPVATAPVGVSSTTDNSSANRIAVLLAEADLAAIAGRYLEPRDQSAVRKYRQVLEIETGNVRATRALQEIAKRYLADFDKATGKKEYVQAEAYLKQAEEVDPSNQTLPAYWRALNEAKNKSSPAAPARKELNRKAAARPASTVKSASLPAPLQASVPAPAPVVSSKPQDREQQLAVIVSRIQEMLAPASLTATRAGLATELYAEAAKISPNDSRVKGAAAQIADAFLQLATARADARDYPEAESLIRRGLEFVPRHRLLASLQKDVTERQRNKPRTFGTF
jgi:serine/threonine-protein kinase PpkA